jgi:hypothetical protein
LVCFEQPERHLEELRGDRGVGVHHHHDVPRLALGEDEGQLLVERACLLLRVADGLVDLDPMGPGHLNGRVAAVVRHHHDVVRGAGLLRQRLQREREHSFLVVCGDEHGAPHDGPGRQLLGSWECECWGRVRELLDAGRPGNGWSQHHPPGLTHRRWRGRRHMPLGVEQPHHCRGLQRRQAEERRGDQQG